MEHVNVLEFGSYLAGPLLGRHLANFGCKVTAILRHPQSRNSAMENERMQKTRNSLNRNKRCIVIDLKKCSEMEKTRLVQDADVLIENFANGVMKKLGLSFKECKKMNPKLIYVSLPGYARHDCEFNDVKAWDSIIMASSGVFCDMGLNRTLLGVRASYSSLPMPSVYGSIFGAFAVMTAIFDERWGEYIEVPLASCLSEALVHNSITFPLNKCYLNQRANAIRNGEYPITETALESLMDPFFSKYMCADKLPLYIVCPAHKRHQLKLIQTLGICTDIFKVTNFVDPYSNSYQRGIGTGHLDSNQAAIVRPLIQKKMLERNASEWERILGEQSIPVIAHKTVDEWLECDHARESGLVEKDDIAPIGWIHNKKAATLEFNQQKMSGLKVVDISNVIAGPTIGAMLARMGAEVIKVDIPIPTYAPEITVVYGIVVNIGKRSILLDISNPEGRRAFDELIKTSDVVIVNSTEQSLKRMHLDSSDLYKINPNIILVRFDAWGGPTNKGPYNNYIGYDDNIQAGIGIMARFGGSVENAEEHAHIGTIDVIAGVAAASTTIFALLLRKHYKKISTVHSSLAAVGQYLQYPHIFGAERPHLGKGIQCRGEHVLHACYDALDGQIIMVASINKGANPDVINNVKDVFGISNITYLAQTLKTRTCKEICAMCKQSNIAAMQLCKLTDVRTKYLDDTCCLTGPTYQYLIQEEHPIGSLIIVAPIAIRMRNVNISMPYAPKYGADTMTILAKVHHTKLIFKSIASVAWSRMYMPFNSKCMRCHIRSRLVIFACGHKICYDCLNELSCLKSCCFCNTPHEMAIVKLRQNYNNWTSAYNNWRRGGLKGARDLEKAFQPSTTLRRTHSAPANVQFLLSV